MCLAELGERTDPFQKPEVIWGTAALAAAMLAGAALVYLADRWRKSKMAIKADSTKELTDFRRMLERGEITEGEYARLRERVAQRVKAPASSGVTTPRADQPSPPSDPGQPANPAPPA